MLFSFCAGDAAPKAFEAWLYANAELEHALSPQAYLSLIAANFNSPEGIREAKAAVEAVLSQLYQGDLPRYRVLTLASDILSGAIDLLTGLRRLVSLYHSGYAFIPEIFVGLESEMDSVPTPEQYPQWEPAGLQRQLEKLEWYRPQLHAELVSLVRRLRSELPGGGDLI